MKKIGKTAGKLHNMKSKEKAKTGNSKTNRREPNCCLGQIFNFKLGRFVMHAIVRHIQ